MPNIQSLFRFRLYRDKCIVRSVLQKRWEFVLDQLLFYLRSTGLNDDRPSVVRLKKDQKVDEILDLVERALPDPTSHLSWIPCAAQDETDVTRIAANIDRMSCSLFKEILFEDWLRHVLGLDADSVNYLLFKHEYMCVRLCSYLRRKPGELDHYMKIEEVR